MKIAVASGKGGTGKTTISVALALSASGKATLLDCDVEEPNAGLFLSQEKKAERPVTVLVPEINKSLCTVCGKCSSLCEFNAIVCIGTSVMAFSELCHSCGGCSLVCPVHAITEVTSPIGTLTESSVPRPGLTPLSFVQGLMTIGNAMSPPIIRAVKDAAFRNGGDTGSSSKSDTVYILDCPPGTSCPMVTAVTGTDYVILVTEPTPFGLHDLDLAVKTVRKMGIPFGVIINRSDSGDERVVSYCERQSIRILMQIPEDRLIAEAYSVGKPLIEADPVYRKKFALLIEELTEGGKA